MIRLRPPVYNVGNNRPVELYEYFETLERYLRKLPEKNLLPLQSGEVPDTFADMEELVRDAGYRPKTPWSRA